MGALSSAVAVVPAQPAQGFLMHLYCDTDYPDIPAGLLDVFTELDTDWPVALKRVPGVFFRSTHQYTTVLLKLQLFCRWSAHRPYLLYYRSAVNPDGSVFCFNLCAYRFFHGYSLLHSSSLHCRSSHTMTRLQMQRPEFGGPVRRGNGRLLTKVPPCIHMRHVL